MAPPVSDSLRQMLSVSFDIQDSICDPPIADWMSPTGTSASTPFASRAAMSSAPKYMHVAANWAKGECFLVALSIDGTAADSTTLCQTKGSAFGVSVPAAFCVVTHCGVVASKCVPIPPFMKCRRCLNLPAATSALSVSAENV